MDLLTIFDWRLIRDPPSSIVLAPFLVESNDSSEPNAMPETLGAGFFHVTELPELSPGYERLVPMTVEPFEGKYSRPRIDFGV